MQPTSNGQAPNGQAAANQHRRRVILAPSLLSADFANLGESVRVVEQAGAEWLHVDVMDGRFVPNITIGPLVVRALRPLTRMMLDCHLMIVEPERYVEDFALAGADIITVHAEATTHLHRVVEQIHALGKLAGVSINPATPLGVLEEILPELDLVLLMSVNPGFGGQNFIPSLYRRAETLRSWIVNGSYDCMIEADGGIKLENIADVYRAGVDAVVSGSGIYGTPDPAATVAQMKEACLRSVQVEL